MLLQQSQQVDLSDLDPLLDFLGESSLRAERMHSLRAERMVFTGSSLRAERMVFIGSALRVKGFFKALPPEASGTRE